MFVLTKSTYFGYIPSRQVAVEISPIHKHVTHISDIEILLFLFKNLSKIKKKTD
nr:MAG TPA: hypothetical protein [Caudoviricetes sp.]